MDSIKQNISKSQRKKLIFREKAVKFALKHGYTKAANTYGISKQNLHNWAKRYNGTYYSLIPKSRRPKSHPNQHTEEELGEIKKYYGKYKSYGNAHVYRKLKDNGYKRSYGSFIRQLKKHQIKTKNNKRRAKVKDRYKKNEILYPGQMVQLDVKYVPNGCIKFKTFNKRYYQITAIDLYSRKRVLKIVNEHSTYETSKFVRELSSKMGFEIELIQTDNGSEFVNNSVNSHKPTLFELTLKELGIKHKRTAPYSPWQNGVVERSHKEDGSRFYNRTFKSEIEMKKAVLRYNTKYNNTAKRVLDFLTPTEKIKEYKMMV